MELRAFEDGQRREVRRPTFLRLDELGNGTIDLLVVDEDGDPIDGGLLMNISQDSVILYGGVDPEFGFELDDDGYLVTENE